MLHDLIYVPPRTGVMSPRGRRLESGFREGAVIDWKEGGGILPGEGNELWYISNTGLHVASENYS